jgi:hypothetical protein
MRQQTVAVITLVFTVLSVSALACNLVSAPDSTGTTATAVSAAPTSPPNDGTRPIVVIETPANGSQAIVQQPFTVRVRATDTIGITRVEMRESKRVVTTQPSPDPVQTFEALLPYKPTSTGPLTLEVVAYRSDVVSDPVSVTLEIVGSQSELRNPGSLDPTAGIASGNVICTAKVNNNILNLRGGPGTNYPIITKLGLGENLTVTGRSADSSWYQVKRENGQAGWVSQSYVLTTGDCSQAPVITPAPQ